MNNDQLWQAVLGEIELNLSKANFTSNDRYFKMIAKIRNTPKNPRDRNSIVVVHHSTGLALPKYVTIA